MNRLRNRLLLIFLAATLAPLCVTLWVANSLLESSLRYSSAIELDRVTATLESTARQYYQRERDRLREQVAEGRVRPEILRKPGEWPPEVREFHESGDAERMVLAGPGGSELHLLRRQDTAVARYKASLNGVEMESVRRQITAARKIVEDSSARDLKRGFQYAFLLLAALPWLASLLILIFAVRRTTRLTMEAYNRMAGELQQSRERLLYLTRLESWQALARKTAHEVKNSLTPIRLMMEEVAARHPGDSFGRQASQIIVDEVNGLERRVRAFSEFAAEPPVRLKMVDANALVEERVAFLKTAHPEVGYSIRASAHPGDAFADEDLLRAVLTNLIKNAAEAAGPGGSVLATTGVEHGKLAIEVHDSGPGLSGEARAALFEPSISFKKGGMGLGLSIARKSAVLCGGDIELVKGELGGAGFRVLLSAKCPDAVS